MLEDHEKEVCPACGDGKLTPEMLLYKPDWLNTDVPLLYSVCDNCGSELADIHQTRFNKLVGKRK